MLPSISVTANPDDDAPGLRQPWAKWGFQLIDLAVPDRSVLVGTSQGFQEHVGYLDWVGLVRYARTTPFNSPRPRTWHVSPPRCGSPHGDSLVESDPSESMAVLDLSVCGSNTPGLPRPTWQPGRMDLRKTKNASKDEERTVVFGFQVGL